jgi:putative ABC transport system permease protein
VIEFLDVPGVQEATRVGRYRATTRLSGGTQRGTQQGTLLGVDRHSLSEVAYWRHDLAGHDLVTLMNALAVYPDGVLVPRTFMAQHGLAVGDVFRASVHAYSQRTDVDLRIVGAFDLFPTWYPDSGEGPLFVGNLDHFFEQASGRFPYRVWLSTDPKVDHERVAESVRTMKLGLPDRDPAPLRVNEVQRRPERQGLFGLLSVGFLAAATFTVLGFLLYALFSFRRRFIEFGILRAIGMSARQMTAFLTWELALLLLAGLAVGTGLGVGTSKMFVPYLLLDPRPTAHVPPYVVQIAWSSIFRIQALFVLLFAVSLGGLSALLKRMKVFEAIKLGETT